MKTVLSFSVLLLFVGLLSGCVREEAELGSGTGRVLTVNYSFDNPLTRAGATDTECKVKDVALFFYNADDAHPDNETYVGCQAVSVPEGNGVSGSFALPLPDAVISGNRYKLIIIGNYNAYPPEGKSPAAYAEQYKARTYSVMAQDIQGQLPSGGTRVTIPLPFSGRLLGQDGNETTLTGPPTTATGLSVSVKFSRAVARFDVTNRAADRLTIAWAKVCNYRTRGYFFHESANAGAIARGTSAISPPLPLPPGYVAAPEPTGTPGALRQDLNTGGLYAFPNFASYTAQDDSVTTCLLVAGYYQDPAAATPNTTRLTYYRLNLGENGSRQSLRRNSIYTLIINSVKKEGAATEEDAMNQKERLLDYEVNNDWESGENGTVTDGAGHSLTLSPTSVALSSEKDDSALITVDAKGGTSWTLAWKNNADNAFRFEKVNDTSFRILTNGKNGTALTRNAELTVTLEGLAAPIQLTVNATQLPTDTDRQILAVEGKQGAFDYPVLGQGAQIALQVITGSPTSRWKAEADADLSGFVSLFTPEGANKGVINLSFPANTGAPRQGTLTVKRLLPDGNEDTSVAPVLITFKQAKSSYVVSLQPDYSESGLTIDAFLAEKGTVNGISKNVEFTVQLADPDHYTFVATCSFNQHSDGFITKGSANTTLTAGPLQTSKSAPSTVEGVNGDHIWLNVFRTGPGDADITGDLTVKAVPKDPASGGVEVTYSIPITLKTSCKIGDSKAGTVLWADRNVGTTPRNAEPVGLNFTNDANSDDHANRGFKGSYNTWDEASGKCADFGTDNHYEGTMATGWRVPTNSEQNVVAGKMCFSKQRGFIVSDDTTAGTVGCWFPFSGEVDNPTTVVGYFWSSTLYDKNQAYYLYVYERLALANNVISGPNGPFEDSVRCVRDLTN